jgi:hypothetical protein
LADTQSSGSFGLGMMAEWLNDKVKEGQHTIPKSLDDFIS